MNLSYPGVCNPHTNLAGGIQGALAATVDQITS